MPEDVVIIGAGIGGLTAGAYLAKFGTKVTIVEKSDKPGGYCGSFKRDGYIFDDAVHYINNMGDLGVLRQICRELGLDSELKVIRIDPSDHLRMPDVEFSVYNDIHKTIAELQKAFPSEAIQIERFFTLISNFTFSKLYGQYKQSSFQDILDQHFTSRRLKTALGLFGTTLGLMPDELSGLAALAYYKGSILDGGYHTVGGAQTFADRISGRFQSYGGTIRFSCSVRKILVVHGRAVGVELEDGTRISSKVVISNCDATQTFTKLLSDEDGVSGLRKTVENLRPSLSNVIVYLGLKGGLTGVPNCCNFWYFPFSDYRDASIDITVDSRVNGFLHISFPSLHDKSMAPIDCENIMLFAGAAFKDQKYWSEHKQEIMEIMIKRAEHVLGGLQERIKLKFIATPQTLLRYTQNREGAYRGWAPTLTQTKLGLIPQKTPIDGLILAGHWITTPIGHGGVSMVAISGRNAARLSMGQLKKRSTAEVVSKR